MKRIRTWLWLFLMLASSMIYGQKSLWLPPLLAQLEETERRESGIKLTGEELYNPGYGSLTGGVVHIAGNCSGTVISGKGLVLTHHECMAGDSSSKPFWAQDQAEEILIPGLSVTFTIRMEEVTESVLKNIPPNLPEQRRLAAIARNIREIEKATSSASYQNARIHSFSQGNQYYLIITETYRDIRLVARFPEIQGKKKGNTPTLPGFSLIRIYADADNRPAGFSKENVPYRPRRFFPVLIGEPKPGGTSLTLGFPGRSDLYLPAVGLQQQMEVVYPAKIEVLDRVLSAVGVTPPEKKENSRYLEIRRSVLEELEMISGKLEGLLASQAITKKLVAEAAFRKILDSNEIWHNRYGRLLPELEKKYRELQPYALARTNVEEIALRRVELFQLLNMLQQFIELYDRFGAASLEQRKGQLIRFVQDFYAGYRPEVDQAVMAEMLELYYTKMPVDLLSPYIAEQVHHAQKDFPQLASFIFIKTALDQPESLLSLLEADLAEALAFVREDPAYTLFHQMVNTHKEKVLSAYESLRAEIELLLQSYLEARTTLLSHQHLTPDANGTLRISTGKLQAEPIFMEDLLPENAHGNPLSTIPFLKAFHSKSYGRYSQDRKLPLYLISNAHTIRGFEGGPVLDASGRLLGIHWGATPESAMSDLYYDPDICRSRALDIRYVLFILDEYAGRLMEEINIAEPSSH